MDLNKVPDRTTMEGMIWNANHVLAQALAPGINGISPKLFDKCKGICLLSTVEAGFIFSGNVGTGIFLAKKPDGSGWSLPCAIGLTGVGWGFLVGGSYKDLLVFLFDDASLSGVASGSGLKFGGQVELTLGVGRTSSLETHLSSKGLGGTLSIAFSKGAFLGLSVEGAVVGSRDAANAAFYGKELPPAQILFQSDAVAYPEGKVTLLDEVYNKLQLLAAGGTQAEPTEDAAKVAAAKSAVEAASASAQSMEGVEHVDASAKAAADSMEE